MLPSGECTVVVNRIVDALVASVPDEELGPLMKLSSRIAQRHLGKRVTMDRQNITSLVNAASLTTNENTTLLSTISMFCNINDIKESSFLLNCRYSFVIPRQTISVFPRSSPLSVEIPTDGSQGIWLESEVVFCSEPVMSRNLSVASKLAQITIISPSMPTVDYQWIFLEEDQVYDRLCNSVRDNKSVENNLYSSLKQKLRHLSIPFISCKLSDISKILTKSTFSNDASNIFTNNGNFSYSENCYCDDIGRVVVVKASVVQLHTAVFLLTELHKIINIKSIFVGSSPISPKEVELCYNTPVDFCVSPSMSLFDTFSLVNVRNI